MSSLAKCGARTVMPEFSSPSRFLLAVYRRRRTGRRSPAADGSPGRPRLRGDADPVRAPGLSHTRHSAGQVRHSTATRPSRAPTFSRPTRTARSPLTVTRYHSVSITIPATVRTPDVAVPRPHAEGCHGPRFRLVKFSHLAARLVPRAGPATARRRRQPGRPTGFDTRVGCVHVPVMGGR